MMNTAKIIAVIVNYNKPFDTLHCIQSVLNNSIAVDKIIVVDNASTDDSVSILQTNPQIELIKNQHNTGGSGGFNTGMKAALQAGADYVWLLDDDAYPDPNYLNIALETFKSHPDTGIVGAQLLATHDHNMIIELGAYINWHEVGIIPVARHQPREHRRLITSTEYTAACCMLVSRQTLNSVGLLNEKYFLHWDDIEFGYRANQKGYKVRINTHALAFHKLYDQIAPPAVRYYDIRNGFYFYLFIAKHWKMKWRVLTHNILLALLMRPFSKRPLDTYVLYKVLWDLVRGKMGRLDSEAFWRMKWNKHQYFVVSHQVPLGERIIIANNLSNQGYQFEVLAASEQETKRLSRFPVRLVNPDNMPYVALFFRHFFTRRVLISTGYYKMLDLCFRQRAYFDAQGLIKKPLSFSIVYDLLLHRREV